MVIQLHINFDSKGILLIGNLAIILLLCKLTDILLCGNLVGILLIGCLAGVFLIGNLAGILLIGNLVEKHHKWTLSLPSRMKAEPSRRIDRIVIIHVGIYFINSAWKQCVSVFWRLIAVLAAWCIGPLSWEYCFYWWSHTFNLLDQYCMAITHLHLKGSQYVIKAEYSHPSKVCTVLHLM